ncbi:MAG: peptidoglycan bridge formation glycyltransferase FemA/FemB family protein [Anaerolineaceae bacterium]|nr:MAG: peptidoglycan bridge formation glycyltransferase FemA/FemB family protein [Anaerolineaceae bacterium]
MKPTLVHDPETWNRAIVNLPGSHLLQSWEWGELKGKYGWRAERWIWTKEESIPIAAAQILGRTLDLPGFSSRLEILYCPRGPALDWSDGVIRHSVLDDLVVFAKRRGAISLKIDPPVVLGYGIPGESDEENVTSGQSITEELLEAGWRESSEQIQFRNTLILDIRNSEEALLAGMKQKTRYNIRLARRRGVEIRTGGMEDIDLLYKIYAETSLRDGFVIRKPEYYQDAWGAFIHAELAQPFIAAVEGETVAALISFRFGEVATFLYGMSLDTHREKMPNHLLQWEAIRWAKEQGCTVYDLWGAPDRLDPSDPMWGVFRFKGGLGARLVRTIGAWDFPARGSLYWLYSIAKPWLMSILRARGQVQTRSLLE